MSIPELYEVSSSLSRSSQKSDCRFVLEGMDQILNKAGTYWFNQKATKEPNSVGDDLNVLNEINRGQAFSNTYCITLYFHKESTSGRDCFNAKYGWIVSSRYMGGNGRKMQKPLSELLKEYNLPVGIFPRDATNYEFNEETGKLTVFMTETCEVGYKDSSVVRFDTTVTGYLEKGKLADIEGLKTKVMIWVKVTSIPTEGTKVYFTAGMKIGRSRDAYEVLRDGIIVEIF